MVHGTAEGPAAPSEDAVRVELARILASRAFARSERQQRFVRYAVECAIEGRPEALKEHALGVEIFNRGRDFDPRADNIVRVEARRLRKRLQDYYQTEGSADPVLIDLPTGGYEPRFSWRTIPNHAPLPRHALISRRAAAAAAAVALAVIAAAAFVWFSQREPTLIAVLPFSQYNAGEAGPYLGDGIAEDILQLLAQTPRLRVVSRTSAFRFRGPGADLSEIRRRLNAKVMLEGSVRQQEGRIRIAARLVDGNTGIPLWAETQEVDAAGLDRAERRIAAGVAGVLKAGSPRPLSSHVPPAGARDLLARARYLAGKGGPENRQRAVEHYERAVTLDPGYAQAWGELARLLSLLAFLDSDSADRLSPRIKDAGRARPPAGRLARRSTLCPGTPGLVPRMGLADGRARIGSGCWRSIPTTRGRTRRTGSPWGRGAGFEKLLRTPGGPWNSIPWLSRRATIWAFCCTSPAASTKRLPMRTPRCRWLRNPRFRFSCWGVVDSGRGRYSEAIAGLERAAGLAQSRPRDSGAARQRLRPLGTQRPGAGWCSLSWRRIRARAASTKPWSRRDWATRIGRSSCSN